MVFYIYRLTKAENTPRNFELCHSEQSREREIEGQEGVIRPPHCQPDVTGLASGRGLSFGHLLSDVLKGH